MSISEGKWMARMHKWFELFLLTAFAIALSSGITNAGEPQGDNVVLNYGVNDDESQDVTAILNKALREALRGQEVFLPTGRYLISGSLLIKSGVTLRCAPGGILVASSKWIRPEIADAARTSGYAAVTNLHFKSEVIRDSDISVDGCGFDYSAIEARRGGQQAIRFRKARNIVVKNVRCLNVGDCTAMLATDGTIVEDSTAVGVWNACWDHWEAPSGIRVINNTCHSSRFGILVTGTNTAGSVGGHSDGKALQGFIGENTVVLSGTKGAGIWLNGLGSQGSGTDKIIIVDNTLKIDSVGGTCIKVSGSGSANEVRNNVCKGLTGGDQNGIVVGTFGDSGGKPSATLIEHNKFENFYNKTGAIITANGDNDVIENNQIKGGNYPFAIRIAGRKQSLMRNDADPGTDGVVDARQATGTRSEAP